MRALSPVEGGGPGSRPSRDPVLHPDADGELQGENERGDIASGCNPRRPSPQHRRAARDASGVPFNEFWAACSEFRVACNEFRVACTEFCAACGAFRVAVNAFGVACTAFGAAPDGIGVPCIDINLPFCGIGAP
jgi:hypothetical protein